MLCGGDVCMRDVVLLYIKTQVLPLKFSNGTLWKILKNLSFVFLFWGDKFWYIQAYGGQSFTLPPEFKNVSTMWLQNPTWDAF